MPTLFSRRKPTRDESSPSTARKLQISGPFNFEHVSSTRREHVADTSNVSTPGPTSAPAMSFEAHHSRAGFPSPETPTMHQLGPMTAPLQQRPVMVGRHTAPASGPRRLVKHVRSQDQLRASPPRAPPRPPRSPKEAASPSFPPVPPPRVSSQAFDNFPASFDRPQTSGGFRRPQPFSSPDLEQDTLPPATSYGYMPPADFDSLEANSNRFSHAITTPDDAAWPLSSPEGPPAAYETPLADVPEEEEGHARRSRMSLTSNKSSLRGSQSVPMLRSLAYSQRPMSGTSDTLGGLDTISGATIGQRQSAGQRDSAAPNDNWEDCIDYCYEHEADANFDYQWERPSLDAERIALENALADDELAEARTTPTSTRVTSGPEVRENITQFLDDSPDRSDTVLPGDSPLGSATSGSNNFSLPRKDRTSHLKLRPMSCASSFKESHGFNLSPSLLIPGDYHQQMLLSTADGTDIDFDHEIPSLPYRNPEESQFEASAVFQQRSSTSTTESASTVQSDSTNGRHISANSSWTASTRLTASTTSLTKLASAVAEREVPLPVTSAPETGKDMPEQQLAAHETDADAVPDLVPFPTTSFGKKSLHKSHASESITREDATALKSVEAQKVRRGRARTTSLSAQAPPVGQYALFPRAYVKGAGDRI